MDRAQLGRSLVHAHAVFQSCDCPEESAALICAWSNRHRQHSPQLRGPAGARALFDMKLKIRRHHADDCKLLIIESDRIANQIRLSAESTLPQSIAQHCDGRLAAFVIFRQERAPEKRIDAEYFEELRRRKLDRQLFRLTSACQVQTLIAERGHVLEAAVLIVPGAEVCARSAVLVSASR